jgi:hypothetical protein
MTIATAVGGLTLRFCTSLCICTIRLQRSAYRDHTAGNVRYGICGRSRDTYLAAGMRNGCALVVVVFMVRDLGVISNSKLRIRIQPYFGTFFETSVLALEFAWRTTQMDADRTSGW